MYRKNNNPIDNNNSNTIINSNSSNKSNQNKECTKKAINLINLNDEINNILLFSLCLFRINTFSSFVNVPGLCSFCILS